MDVGKGTELSCFVVVCLCCYNLGRFDHEAGVGAVSDGPDAAGTSDVWVEFECRTCGAKREQRP